MSAGGPDRSSGMPLPKQTGQVDTICDAFEAAWFAGKEPRIESFVSEGEPVYREYLLRELLIAEWELRQQGGQTIDVHTYVERFPGHNNWISELYTDWSAADRAAKHSTVNAALCHDGDGRVSGNSNLSVRCPNCHSLIELVADSSFSKVTCRVCSGEFSLTQDGSSTQDAATLRKIGHFELIERIGLGAFGTVWKARDTRLDRTVAVKIPRKGQLEPGEIDKFLREARTTAQLRHPNILTVYEVGRDGDIVFIVSDLVRGITLSDWLTGEQMTAREAAELCAKIGDALHYAHEQGVIHRDLKPQNIMLDTGREPHLMDFGLARRDAGEITMTMDGHVLGTPAYMSPEQARGEAHRADRRTDVYSLGVILFQLLTDELPFRGNARMLIHQVLNAEAPRPRRFNVSVPRDLETICLKCLEKEASKRFDTAKEVAEELRRHLVGKPILARRITPIARGWRWCRRNPVVASLGAILGTMLLILGIAGPIVAILQTNLRHRAEQATGRLRQTTDRLHQQIYSANLNVAHRALLEGNLGLAVELLNKHVPQPGELDLRGFEWRYLWAQCRDESQHTFPPHANAATVVAFSPDGESLVTASFDQTARLWKIGELGHGYVSFAAQGRRNSVKFLSGNLLLVNAAEKLVLVDPISKAELREFGPVFSDDPFVSTTAVAISKSERVASEIQEGVGIWDSGSTEPYVIRGSDQPFGTLLAFSAEEDVLSIAHMHHVRFWNLQSKAVIDTFSVNESMIKALAGAKRNPLFAIGRKDGSVDLLRVVEGRIVSRKTWRAHSSLAFGLAFSPNEEILVTGGADQMIHMWDVRVLLSEAVDIQPLRTLRGHKEQVWAIAFSPDGKMLASASKDGEVKLWDLVSDATGRKNGKAAIEVEPRQFQIHDRGPATVYSHDKRLLARVEGGVPQLWEAKTNHVLYSLRGHFVGVNCMAFSPSDRLLATGGMDNEIRIWDTNTGTVLDELRGHFTGVSALTFSLDERTLVSGGSDGTVKLWSVETGQEMISHRFSQGTIAGLHFSQSGDSLGIQFKDSNHPVESWHAPSLVEIEAAETRQANKDSFQ